MTPIKAASAAKPPPSPASPTKRRRAQQCRRCAGSPPPDYRHSRATECARLIPVTTRRRPVAKPRTPHLHCAARAALQAANCQCRGSRGTPLVLLWGIQRGYSLREENTPFAWQWRSAPHYPCSANGAAPPIPREGGKQRGYLFEKRIPPLPGSSAKSCTNSCSAVGAATPIPTKGDQRGYPLRKENKPM